jgi:hypothetical protein
VNHSVIAECINVLIFSLRFLADDLRRVATIRENELTDEYSMSRTDCINNICRFVTMLRSQIGLQLWKIWTQKWKLIVSGKRLEET